MLKMTSIKCNYLECKNNATVPVSQPNVCENCFELNRCFGTNMSLHENKICGHYCSNCKKEINNYILCYFCKDVWLRYCSTQCSDNNLSFHSGLCIKKMKII